SSWTYGLYHASLRDFFTRGLDPTHLTEAERAFTEELAEATRRAHGRIVDQYVSRWGGWADSLPALRDGADLNAVDRYGLRHLAAHLEGSGQTEELHALLRLEWRDWPAATPGAKNAKHLGSLPGRVSPRDANDPSPLRVRRHNAWFTAHDRTDDL